MEYIVWQIFIQYSSEMPSVKRLAIDSSHPYFVFNALHIQKADTTFRFIEHRTVVHQYQSDISC